MQSQINDKCCLNVDESKKRLQMITAQRHGWETSGRRELGSVGKDQTETGRIPRRASEREGKTNSDKGPDLERFVSYLADHECAQKR